MDEDLHGTDFWTWRQRQAEHLRAGRLARAEEIESLGKSQAAALRSAYRLIAPRLLEMMIRPGRMAKRWRPTTTRERIKSEWCLKAAPG